MKQFSSTLSHSQHKNQNKDKAMNPPKLQVTQAYIKLSDSKYEGIAKNPKLTALAERIVNIKDQVQYIKESGTLNVGEITLQTHQLFTKQKGRITGMAENALNDIEDRAKTAKGSLFSSTSAIRMEESALTPAILEMYRDPKSDTAKMIANPESARHLTALSRLGLVPESIRQSINKKHSPEATQQLEELQGDLGMLATMEKEYKSMENLMNDPKAAERLIKMGKTGELD